jgi:hypothetical protein
VDVRELGADLRQSAAGRLSGERPKPDPWRQLADQCARAERGDDGQLDYLTMQF